MVLNDESTWPSELRDRIAADQAVFLDHELRRTRHPPAARFDAPRWDRTVIALSEFIAPYSIRGFHCTRLTDEEIATIEQHGMQLPNHDVLSSRICRLQEQGLLRPAVARRLLAKNDAKNQYRADRLWFCFFSPRIVSQQGIERFFRCWGGEALYCDHESDPFTGPALAAIGTPCVIEAEVPLAGIDLRYALVERFGRQFLLNRGLKTMEPAEHEDHIRLPLPAAQIVRIIRFPSADFLSLTDCATWDPLLQ